MNIISELMERVRKRYLLYAHYIISTYNTAKSADKMLMGLNYADKYVVHEETQKTLKFLVQVFVYLYTWDICQCKQSIRILSVRLAVHPHNIHGGYNCITR